MLLHTLNRKKRQTKLHEQKTNQVQKSERQRMLKAAAAAATVAAVEAVEAVEAVAERVRV